MLPFKEKEIRVLAGTAVMGSGFLESSLNEGLRRLPHFIGCDAGSTDPGPHYLGAGEAVFSRDAVKRDMRLLLLGARKLKVPLLIGSAGTSGGDVHLDWAYGILKEIAAEESLQFKLALIHAEQDKDYLKKRLAEGRIKPLLNAPHFDDAVIDRSSRIVGMMGAEPFVRALDAGADVVLAGRASDTAIYAAIPVHCGFPEGLAWHAAKILECGTGAVVSRKTPDCMMATIRHDHCVVEPLDPTLECTPQSVAAHALYENGDPFKLIECTGTLDITNAKYEVDGDRSVRITRSAFIPAKKYTVKLEGAEFAGYQNVIIGGVRDPFIIGQIDDWTVRLREKIQMRVTSVHADKLKPADYVIGIRIYGKNGVMGALEPVKEIRSHEICLVIEITAPTQEFANSIASMTRHQALHLPIKQWSGMMTTMACPYNPAYLKRGPIYRFNVNHVVEPDDPCEMFPMELVQIGAGNGEIER
jgi:hypothetical protein